MTLYSLKTVPSLLSGTEQRSDEDDEDADRDCLNEKDRDLNDLAGMWKSLETLKKSHMITVHKAKKVYWKMAYLRMDTDSTEESPPSEHPMSRDCCWFVGQWDT